MRAAAASLPLLSRNAQAIHLKYSGTRLPRPAPADELSAAGIFVVNGTTVPRMYLADWLALFDDLKLHDGDMTRKETRLAFLFARMFEPDEVGKHEHNITLGFIDFLEALARIALVRDRPSAEATHAKKLDCLCMDMIKAVDHELGDGDGQLDIKDFKNFKGRFMATQKVTQIAKVKL
jgi:hypothetical protein